MLCEKPGNYDINSQKILLTSEHQIVLTFTLSSENVNNLCEICADHTMLLTSQMLINKYLYTK